MSFNPTAEPGKVQEVATAALLAELKAREASISRRLEILDTSAEQAATGEEFFVIRQRRLYRAAGFKSFAAYLKSRRTPVSRSRAYQLIHYFTRRREAALKGATPPVNERQSRAMNSGEERHESFEERWTAIFKYLKKRFSGFPVDERPRFVQALEALAKMFAAYSTKSQTKADEAQ